MELRKQLTLQGEAHIQYTGPDWLLMILDRYDMQTNANFLMLIWRCWAVRNGVLKVGEGISIAGSVAFLMRYSAELTQIRQQNFSAADRGKQKLDPEQRPRDGPPKTSSNSNRWVPPLGQPIKINTDGAFSQTGITVVGGNRPR